MSMRCARLLVLGGSLLVAGAAAADKLGGFSGVDRPYLVNQDRVCTPLPVTNGAATGAPSCKQAGADVVARLSFKAPIPQLGPKATFAATASGRTITVIRKASGTPVVTWSLRRAGRGLRRRGDAPRPAPRERARVAGGG
jgi:hypothetical protein